jgi:hypothetical protein
MRRLDTPELARVVAEPKESQAREVPELEERLAQLADLFGAGSISQAEWLRARASIDSRLEKARNTRDQNATSAALRPYRAGALRSAWDDLTIDQRRSVIAAVIESVVIAQATRGAVWDEQRVSVSRWLA